jgi:hypothetical protein
MEKSQSQEVELKRWILIKNSHKSFEGIVFGAMNSGLFCQFFAGK